MSHVFKPKLNEDEVAQRARTRWQKLEAVLADGKWKNRREIAKALGKARLNYAEVTALEQAVMEGVFEVELRAWPRQNTLARFYRLKREEARDE